MMPEELVGLCAAWQRVLRLQDWTVRARFVRATEMDTDAPKGRSGEVCWNNKTRDATVLVLCAEDYDATHRDGYERNYDPEVTLVHELLHLYWAPLAHVIPSNSIEDRFEEQAVEALARAFVALKRGEVSW
jgi:hypothetical protein